MLSIFVKQHGFLIRIIRFVKSFKMRSQFKYLLHLFIFLFTLNSCSKSEGNETEEIKRVPAEVAPEDHFDYDTLRGMYIGDFGRSPIRIVLNYVSSSNAIGYNIHKGLQRNLNGKVSRNGDTTRIILNEPGDHEYDGTFELIFDGIDKNPKGKWEHLEGWIPSKKLKLSKFEMEKPEGDEIRASNFADYFSVVFDSLGTFYFEDDGLVRYEYYPTQDQSARVEQKKEVRGSWFLEDSTLLIEWQKNYVFKEPKITYIVSKSEWGGPVLRIGSEILYANWW